MKVFLCSLAIILVAICLPCQAKGGVFKECKTESGLTDEIKKGQFPNLEDSKVKCFITCLGKKFGIIVDGKVNAEKFIEKLSKKLNLDDAKKEAVKGCAEEANKQSDCEVGSAMLKCLKEKGISMKGKKKENENSD
ncbi:general odorant-binding protein 19d-like [Copidosoma floridanum]|uniref:general odorant-binding protein 19d-like n=1 Tax=Copidosoma floridanum TaxID=29053 RepID=UPI0006C9D2F7|nr:general odorant-binding protein 19d-like [Copidosoma floridanum]